MRRRGSGSTPPAPADLSPESAAVWPGLAADIAITMGAAEVDFVVLHDVLLARDRLAQVRAVLDAEGLTVSGSKGQSRPHPLLVTESVLRREVADGLRRLRLDSTNRFNFEVGPDGRLRPPY